LRVRLSKENREKVEVLFGGKRRVLKRGVQVLK
jgi:hypothetical protein